MNELSEDQFAAKVEQAPGTVLLDFGADWCPPCKMLHPVIERISLEYNGKLDVYEVDVDKNQSLSQRFGISGVPTVLLFKDGKEVNRLVGFRDFDTLKGEIDGLI
jgi:thioredoxin 1